VIYVDSPKSAQGSFGPVANLSFESGAMFLDGNIVMMKFPTDRKLDTGYILEAYVTPNDSKRFSSSGYELGESEPFVAKDGTILVDPILFYSQNSHLICKHTTSLGFHGRSPSSPVLLLLPDFPWLVGSRTCTRVKLINMPDSRSRNLRKVEFSPTGLYSLRPQEPPLHYNIGLGQQGLYSEQPSSQLVGNDRVVVRPPDMYFAVECQAEDQCLYHGRVITLTKVRKLISHSPSVLTSSRRDPSRCSEEDRLKNSEDRLWTINSLYQER
jgi:hypothetical protein